MGEKKHFCIIHYLRLTLLHHVAQILSDVFPPSRRHQLNANRAFEDCPGYRCPDLQQDMDILYTLLSSEQTPRT